MQLLVVQPIEDASLVVHQEIELYDALLEHLLMTYYIEIIEHELEHYAYTFE